MGWNNLFQCEKDEWCLKLLNQNYPNTHKHGDIKTTDFSIYRGRVDIITGGFPCQPYSTAGKRLGKEDERHLWPEMLRAIREVQPPWVVGENVRGLTNWNGGLVFDEVQADLEAAGYEVTPFLLPAAGVNAPHRRDRIFFIAYSAGFRCNRELYKGEGIQWGEQARREIRSGYNEAAPNSQSISEREPANEANAVTDSREAWSFSGSGSESIATDTNSNQRSERGLYTVGSETAVGYPSAPHARVAGYWEDFPTQPGICGGDARIPHRVDRLKGLGNAVVPQVVLQIFKAIQAYEDLKQ